MPITVEVTDEVFKLVSKDGNKYEKQVAYISLPDKRYPVEMKIFVSSEGPFMPGNYVIDDKSFQVNNYGDLKIGRLVLNPVPVKAAARAAG